MNLTAAPRGVSHPTQAESDIAAVTQFVCNESCPIRITPWFPLESVSVELNDIIRIVLVIILVLQPPTDGFIDEVSGVRSEMIDELNVDTVGSGLDGRVSGTNIVPVTRTGEHVGGDSKPTRQRGLLVVIVLVYVGYIRSFEILRRGKSRHTEKHNHKRADEQNPW